MEAYAKGVHPELHLGTMTLCWLCLCTTSSYWEAWEASGHWRSSWLIMTREGQIGRKEQNFLEPGYVYLGLQSLGAGVSYFWLSYTYSLSHPYHSGISKVFFFLASQEPVPCSRSSSTDLFSQSTPDSIPMTAIIICMLLSLRPDLSPDL